MIKGAIIRYFGGSRDQPEPGSLPQRMLYIVYRAEVKTLACEVEEARGLKHALNFIFCRKKPTEQALTVCASSTLQLRKYLVRNNQVAMTYIKEMSVNFKANFE